MARPRVTARAGGAPGVLFSGPAGTGKTFAAAGLADAATHVRWVRLAPGYSAVRDLVALGGADVSAATTVTELAGELLGVLDEQPTTLVIDDYHFGDGDACDPLIAEVLPLIPAGSRMVLCSRTRPAGLVGRASEGLLRVVDARDLAFDVPETTALFAARGVDASAAADVCGRVAGWPAGVALAAESGDTGAAATDALVRRMLLEGIDAAERAALDAIVVLPYVTAELAGAVGVDVARLATLADRTSLVTDAAGLWRLHDGVRETLAELVPAERANATRRQAASVLERDDPGAAIDVYLAAGEPDAAAGVLERHLSQIGVQRAVHWLYQLPAELRRQFPPVLAAGRATVNLDEAVARAEAAVETATDDAARREARFALGSALAHTGQLSAAAAAFEAALPGAPPAFAARIQTWLGITRWWAGDLAGARSALVTVENSALAAWARAEIARCGDDAAQARSEAEASQRAAADAGVDADMTAAPAMSVLARLDGDLALAARAYELAARSDGIDLGAAAPTYAALLVNAGRFDEAEAVTEVVNRRIGRHDAFAKLHVHLLRAAIAAARGDAAALARAEEETHRARQAGFATVESSLRSLLAPLQHANAPSLRVDMLGPTRVSVNGEVVPLSAWKSHKALEVLTFLAVAGERGAHREEVIEAVWPDRDPQKGRVLLRAALSEIRRRIEPQRQAGEASLFLHTSGDRVSVLAATDAAEVRTRPPAEALALFRGGFVDDNPYADWVFEDRRAMENLRTELAERVAHDASLERSVRAPAYDILISAEPWRAALYDELAALHRDAGDEAAARAAERRRDDW